MTNRNVSDHLMRLTGRESGVYIEGDFATVVNWSVDPPCWLDLPAVVDSYRVEDIRRELPVDIRIYQDADIDGAEIEICGGTISDDARDDVLGLWGLRYAGRTIYADDVDPTGGMVYVLGNNVTIITPDGWC